MKCPLLMLIHTRYADHGVPLQRFYEYFNITRQAFFQGKQALLERTKKLDQMSELIRRYRKEIDRRAGSRTLYHNLKVKAKFRIGISKFERLLSESGLTLARMRTKVVTTQSSTQSWNYANLCNGLIINGINQLIVGDITYVSIHQYRFYLFCLTDVFSARIVGFKLSDRMRTGEAIEALNGWIKLRGKSKLEKCIHHTDGGGQYFSKAHLAILTKLKVKISVAENCLNNPYAEQKNSIIKHHLLPTMQLTNLNQIESEMIKIIANYNFKRRQKSLRWLTPVAFESKLGDANYNPQLILHDHKNNIPSSRIGF